MGYTGYNYPLTYGHHFVPVVKAAEKVEGEEAEAKAVVPVLTYSPYTYPYTTYGGVYGASSYRYTYGAYANHPYSATYGAYANYPYSSGRTYGNYGYAAYRPYSYSGGYNRYFHG